MLRLLSGFNGSGKSNVFNAILFVISDHFGSLRQESWRVTRSSGTFGGKHLENAGTSMFSCRFSLQLRQ
jgi:predicted ATPase